MERYCNRDCEMKHKNTGKKWRKKSDVTNPLLAGPLCQKLTHLYAAQQAQFNEVPLLKQMQHGSAKVRS